MVCGASLPTTIVSYSVPVNVLKIEYFWRLNHKVILSGSVTWTEGLFGAVT
jgi:hypothetical protein